jgi:Domain of unknown function (DUF4062)
VAVKKYQIFISSTFADLQEERNIATKAILDLDHIPAGMELFPAVDMDQFEYIKKVIDECDYYVLIIGARYGSVDNDGVGYTEREFDYAVATNKTVIALINNDIENLPRKKFDTDLTLFEKLEAFRNKVKTGRMVRMWNSHDQLVSGLMQAISRAIQIYPAPGWVRGDTPASDEILQQYVQLRATYDELYKNYQTLIEKNSAKVSGLAPLTDTFTIHFRYRSERGGNLVSSEICIAWSQIFKIIGPSLFSPHIPSLIESNLKAYLYQTDSRRASASVNDNDVSTIKIHFHALGLINIYQATSKAGGVQEYISLTDNGRATLVEIMAVRAAGPEQA